MPTWAALGGLAMLLLAGCFSPDVPSGAFACGTGGSCPSGQQCDTASNVCVAPGGGGDVDAALDVPDARIPDAPRPDGRRDAAPPLDAPVLPDGFMCTPGAVLGCKSEDQAFVCNEAGTGIDEVDCPGGCDAVNLRCNQCPPATTLCSGDKLVACSAQGMVLSETTCVAGCDDSTASPHACFVITPLNLPAEICRTAGGVQPTFPPGRTVISTTECLNGQKISQGNGLPELCVFKYGTVQIPAGRTIDFRGERVPVFVATSLMTVDGTIDVAARADEGGPGASPNGDGQGHPGDSTSNDGGGGGGAGSDGAPGGASAAGETGGAPGLMHPRTRHLYPGGAGGIGGPCILCERLSGGGGGGALNLVSCGAMRFGATAVISAGGGGGLAGTPGAAFGGGGDGGGAGGDVLIEAAEVTVMGGVLVANGGGGGSGASLLDPGQPGDDAALIAGPAAGGSAVDGSGGGGDGGTGLGGSSGGLLPLAGQAPSFNGPGPGGGGGAAGRLRALARPDKPITIPGDTIISPALIRGPVGRAR